MFASKSVLRVTAFLLLLTMASVAWTQDIDPPQNRLRNASKPHAFPKLIDASRLGATDGANLLVQGGFRVEACGRALVEIVGPLDSQPQFDATIASLGGQVTAFFAGRTEAVLPIDALESFASQLPTTHRLEPAGFGMEVSAHESQGPGIMASNAYRDAGFDGTGIKICIIDIGYAGLNSSINSDDAPANYDEYNYTARSFQAQADGSHGRFVVETLYDHAPGASYVIMKVDDQTDLGQAVQDAINENVDIINMSLGWWPDWADDGDAAAVAANNAANAGILFMNSAGNEALEHYQGVFSDGDNDGMHSWSGNDELLSFSIPSGSTFTARLTFDPAGGNHDYDLFVFDNAGIQEFAASEFNGEVPDQVQIGNPNPFAIQATLAVQRISGPGTTIEIYSSGGTWNEHAVAAGSTTTPSNATASNVVSVGAVEQDLYGSPKYSGGLNADYSSQGPTNDGMLVPDVCGPTSTSVSFNPVFTGTSCACPNAAGVAACLWSVNPAGTAAQVRALLYEWADFNKDWGPAGDDMIYGRGGVSFPEWKDCNLDNWPDAFDVASGGSSDNNGNWIPDECEGPIGGGYKWVGQGEQPLGKLGFQAAINPSVGTGPLTIASGFTMSFPYDPAIVDQIIIRPAQQLEALIGATPAVFDVTDTGSMVVIECTFQTDATGAPMDLTIPTMTEAVEAEYKIVVLGGGGVGSATSPATFAFTDVSTAVPPILNGLHTASGGFLPATLPAPLTITAVETTQYLYQIHDVGNEEIGEFFLEYDPAAPGTDTFDALWSIREATPDPTPTSAVSMALKHDPSYLTATAFQLTGSYAALTPDVLLVGMAPDGLSVDIVWSALPIDFQTFANNGESLGAVTYVRDGAALLSGNNAGATTMIEFDTAIAGSSNHVLGPDVDETPAVQHGIVHLIPATPAAPVFRRGDVDGNNSGTVGDAVIVLSYLFAGGAVPSCLDAADANDDSVVTIADPVFILTYLFNGGMAPPAPGIDTCGSDPTPDLLDCQSFGC